MTSQLTNYSYDADGRLVQVSCPDGALTTYGFDAAGNRTSVSETPPSITPTPSVASLPKPQNGDFINQAMVVLLSTGELIGWGDNNTGALANGLTSSTSQPPQRVNFDPNTTMPPANATIVDWAFTNGNLYVVFSNGWVYSAGDNTYGQLGQGDTTARDQLKRIEYFVTNNKSITKVWACGSSATTDGGGCVYFQASDNSMYGCGANSAGNLGSNGTNNVTTPALCSGITTSPNVVDVQIGPGGNAYFSTYMVMSNGGLMVAGYNADGQLGTGTTSNVTGGFVSATISGGANIANVASLSYNANTGKRSALALDTAGNIWTVGNNSYGQLGQGDTTNRTQFTQVSGLPPIAQAAMGGGQYGIAYALTVGGLLYTWGYNGNNNLFQNNSTSPVKSPTLATFIPGQPAKIFFPKGNALSSSAQLVMLTTGNVLAFAGSALGQISFDNAISSGAYSFVPLPKSILDGSEFISDVFVHGTSGNQRWFVLTNAGNLYACGYNSSAHSICTGGIASDTPAANVECFRISLS